MPADPARKRIRPARLATLLLASALLFGGCAGLRPNPTYNSERGKAEKREERKQQSSKKAAAGSRAKPRKTPVLTGGNDALDRQVNLWWGTPYAWGGNGHRGVDCSGYVCAVYTTVYGINLPRTSREQYKRGRPIERNQLRRGDLIFFNTDGTGVSHVGIYLGGGRFTHASNSDGVTIDKLSSPYYSKRYLGARRIR